MGSKAGGVRRAVWGVLVPCPARHSVLEKNRSRIPFAMKMLPLPPSRAARDGCRPGLARGRVPVGALLLLFLFLTGCSGEQSALDPAGRAARQIAELFWWMVGGTVVVWGIVAWLTLSAMRGRVSQQTAREARHYIIGGGVVFPTVVLAGLLVYGLGMMPAMIAPAPEGSLRIAVTGEQWWWRVRYELPDENGDGGDGSTVGGVDLANEIRLPVGEPVEFTLESTDVIHSFWIPSLGGKMDMIPGRTTRLALVPERTGTYRGVCAEYCGDSHALMAFDVVVMEKADFAEWLEQQQAPAAEPEAESAAARGRQAFLSNGCTACHTVRGLEGAATAAGAVGPDLTHFGSRRSLGAGTLPNTRENLRRWLAETDMVKPGVPMPHFGMLPGAELDDLAAYLESLK